MRPTYFNDHVQETLPLASLRRLQDERLRQTVLRVTTGNVYYRKLFESVGLDASGIAANFRGIEDITKLPTTSKDDFRKSYPLGMCCVPKMELREMHMSSGSTGSPIVMPYTVNDLNQWAMCMARCYRMAGTQPGDVIQITPTFGLFNGGFGMYHGARAADLFVVPTGSGNTERQIRLAKDFGTRIFGGVASYGIRLLEALEASGSKLESLEIGIFGAETFTAGLKERLTNGLGIEVFDIYGMTETGGVGTLGMDCPAHCGIHVWEDQYYAEVINPATGGNVPDGTIGELVITSLQREALPVIRFRTGDLTSIVSRDVCECGRTHVRIAPISGRTDDMLIIKGVNFFPSQVEQALLEIPGVLPHYQIIIEETDGVKDIRVNVEVESGVTGFVVEKHLKEKLGFSPKGDVFKAGELPRQDGKAQRVFYKSNDKK
ncbi:MAG: phenylacetate--CoA ligase [Planctomycetaceae bacterium]|jgi:phenylacetate-CoA ligase|nr:phenylacetate--CoA ligase [Planctomycetaceae bacterium]